MNDHMNDNMNLEKPPYRVGVVVLCALLFEFFAPYVSKSLEFGALLFIAGFLPVVGLAFVCKVMCVVVFNRPSRPLFTHLCGLGFLIMWLLNLHFIGPSAPIIEAGLADKLWLQGVGGLVGWMASLEFPAPKRRRRSARGNLLFQHLRAWMSGLKPQPIRVRAPGR